MNYFKYKQQGYLLLLAVVFIMVVGIMGTVITSIFISRAQMGAMEINGLISFYLAESALTIGNQMLSTPDYAHRTSCAALTGQGSVTDASLYNGHFTLTSTNSAPRYAVTALASNITSVSTSLTLSSTAAFGSQGRVLIDREAIDYSAISGNTLIGLRRGVNNTLASSHPIGAGVGQYQCEINAAAGSPNLNTPDYLRQLKGSVQLQDGFAVGARSGNSFSIIRWNYPTEGAQNNYSFSDNTNREALSALSILSNADGWAVGTARNNNFNFVHWDGTAWDAVPKSGACSNQNLNGISMVSDRSGYAVGVTYRVNSCNNGGTRYTILSWNGSTWTLLAPSTIPADSASNQTLNAVSVLDSAGDGIADRGFAVGNAGRILSLSGTTWTATASPVTNNLLDVQILSLSQAWAVGTSGRILRWNGTTWSVFSSPTSTQLNGVRMLDTNGDGIADFGIAVGNNGVVIMYNGTSWVAGNAGSSNLFGVDIYNQKDAWAVGAGGAAYHWDGDSWSNVSTPTGVQLNYIRVVRQYQNTLSSWQQNFN